MHKKLITLSASIFLLSISIFLPVKSEIVKEIIISGNERVSDQTIKMFGKIELNQNLEINEINNILREIYNSNFFDDVKVSLDNNILKIVVSEKPIIENVIYEGLKSKEHKTEIINSRILKPRSSYDEIRFTKDRQKILSILKERGYYFADITSEIESIGNNKLNLKYKINLGEKSKIKKISFVGNKVYKDKKLKNVIISEESKFWKFISGKKYLNENIINLDKRLLKNFYLNKGYYDAEINSSFARFVDKNNFEIIYNINAKEKFYFDKIKLELTDDYDKNNFSKLNDEFDDLQNKPYSINRIEKIINKIERIALDEQFESVKVNTLENINGNKINLIFKIEDTEKFFV